MSDAQRRLLVELFEVAVATAHPRTCLAPHLPHPPGQGRILVIGAGKAGAAMAAVAEEHYRLAGVLDRVSGFTTAPHGSLQSLPKPHPKIIEVIAARHPTPDAASMAAAERALGLAASATANDLVVVLLSGGASALWAAPVAGIDLAAKTALTRGLLKSGADIHEMNTVRRHISRIKGGRLRQAASAARMLTLAISDVPGDDPQTIGSGPTVADPTTLDDAQRVLAKRRERMEELGLDVPDVVTRALGNPSNETPKPGDPLFASSEYRIIATPVASLKAACDLARRNGYAVDNLGDRVTGEARDVAAAHAALARAAHAAGRRVAIVSGGELEVTVRNRSGRGGRSQEYALALAIELRGLQGVSALAADTDGIDGGEGNPADPAGATIDATTLRRGGHVRAKMMLDNNDATPFFAEIGDLVTTGPTHTNVNDFRAILVDP